MRAIRSRAFIVGPSFVSLPRLRRASLGFRCSIAAASPEQRFVSFVLSWPSCFSSPSCHRGCEVRRGTGVRSLADWTQADRRPTLGPCRERGTVLLDLTRLARPGGGGVGPAGVVPRRTPPDAVGLTGSTASRRRSTASTANRRAGRGGGVDEVVGRGRRRRRPRVSRGAQGPVAHAPLPPGPRAEDDAVALGADAAARSGWTSAPPRSRSSSTRRSTRQGHRGRGAPEGLAAVCFLGDDIGDLPAFDALDASPPAASNGEGRGAHARGPTALARPGRLVVDGPDGALDAPPLAL